MSNTGSVAVAEVEAVESVAVVADLVAGFWASQLLIKGVSYHRHEDVSSKKSRETLRLRLQSSINERLMSMEAEETGDQWLINHLSEPYPPFMRALRESGISGGSWPVHSSMSIVYRDGIFNVHTRRPRKGRRVDRHRLYQVSSPSGG